MKKLIYLSLLLVIVKAEAQKGVVFKMKYLPDHSYDGSISLNLNCNVAVSGDSAIVNKLKAQGFSQPMVLDVKLKMIGDTKSGSISADSFFPLTLKFKPNELSANLNGKDLPIPMKGNTEIAIYGKANADGKIQIDSVSGQKSKDTSDKKMSQMMNLFQKMVKFPDHPLHIGDTFTQEVPLNIPMQGTNLSSNAKTVYKLTKIDNGKAYFDILQNINITIPIKEDSVELMGEGTGAMVFDIKNNFPVNYESNVSLKLTAKIKALHVDGTARMAIDYNYTVN